ncbi:PREDICTED: uncharacterized protein LOC109329297 [Lupinus angustifolius]|uniref:uncharacterized protein LOC109329297 n=1 Tax=Lupinus angustifolius TaxID=3871 RepID=UPI00092F039A|nr:PREDICTED: uncharacterized protein LOC109329297 [Lupinus angustifolius]
MDKDASKFTKKCTPCQLFADLQKAHLEELTTTMTLMAIFCNSQRNGTQFSDRKFKELLSGLHIKQHFTSVERPQANGQVEAANKVLLCGIKRRLQEANGVWSKQLHHVLWAYHTTPHSTTGESPFNLTYGFEAMIPVEIGEPPGEQYILMKLPTRPS